MSIVVVLKSCTIAHNKQPVWRSRGVASIYGKLDGVKKALARTGVRRGVGE